MERSTAKSWLEGPGDLTEDVVEDVPVKGENVKVRGLPAAYSDEAMSDAAEVVMMGSEQVQRYNVSKLRVLQFAHGCIEPQFSTDDARKIAERWGPAFDKVVDRIQELSNIDEEAVRKAQTRFPSSGGSEDGVPVEGDASAGNGGPDVPSRTGA